MKKENEMIEKGIFFCPWESTLSRLLKHCSALKDFGCKKKSSLRFEIKHLGFTL